jgi:bifunctional DNA-binding transcriptional regulator/antitoxin component of YhaV-PrlF toxin-antitoxin module
VVVGVSGGTLQGMTERYVTFRTDAKGRTVIPAALRAQARIRESGDVLVGHVEGERLIIETRDAIKRRLRAQAAATGATGVVDGLLVDRRADRELEKPALPATEG